MKKTELRLPVSKDCLTLIAVCLLGLALLVSLGILPMKKKIEGLAEDIAQARLSLELHDALEPINQELDLRRKKDLRDFPPAIKNVALPQSELNQAEQFLRTTASRVGLSVISMNMDLASASKSETGLEVNLKLKGGFDAIRHYLDALSRLPYLGRIGEVRISEDSADRILEIKLMLSMN